MKVGVMLRHLGQHGGGVLVYTQNLLREMLTLDTPHEFVLLYREPSWLGSYNNGNGGRVRELALGKAPTIMWDQWLVPQVEKREKFDLIFNPKYSLPLLSKSRTVDEIALIDQLGISQWVLWPGWIDHKILPVFYALAEALVLPSLYESFGIPILEAMSSGCPIVTTNRYGPVELAGAAAILVNPEEVESIADGMRRVVSDQNLRQQLIRAGRERAKDFSWEKCGRETLGVLEKIGAQQM